MIYLFENNASQNRSFPQFSGFKQIIETELKATIQVKAVAEDVKLPPPTVFQIFQSSITGS